MREGEKRVYIYIYIYTHNSLWWGFKLFLDFTELIKQKYIDIVLLNTSIHVG